MDPGTIMDLAPNDPTAVCTHTVGVSFCWQEATADYNPLWPGADGHKVCVFNAGSRVLWQGGMAVAIMCVNYLAIRLLAWGWTSFELNEISIKTGETRESFTSQAALNLVGGLIQCYLGPAALYSVVSSSQDVLGGISPQFARTEQECTIVASSQMEVGFIFTGYIWAQIGGFILGWERRTLDNTVHHSIFALLSFSVQYNMFGNEATASAMIMELSTPLLYLMLTFRRCVGHNKLANILKPLFGLVFLAVRVVGYGYLLITRQLVPWLLTEPQTYQTASKDLGISTSVVTFIQLLFTAGWCLQLFWAYGMAVSFFKRTHKPKES